MARKREVFAFQGERGAFSEIAARQFAGGEVEVLPCQRFQQLFENLRAGNVDGAVVPIENTLHGSVHENYDHLLNFELPIAGETSVRIVHNLIALPGVKFRDVRRVFSHPVALNQCLRFFEQNPQVEKETFYDTAGSVKMLAEEKLTDAAAIAAFAAAEIYGAHILRRSIEDDRQNHTRFFLLRRPEWFESNRLTAGKKGWKTSLVFSTRNVPGALFRGLSALALRDLNLTKIESRPLRGKPWEYLFYVDLLGNVEEERVKNALRHLAELADLLRVLGSYPRGS
ncbi:MAG: prephenate dehydratase [Acidobacteria bacterium]|nr:prephenate dehydratase [Acidobacteriota bacterium]